MRTQKRPSLPTLNKIVFGLSLFVLFFVSAVSYRQLELLHKSDHLVRLSDHVNLELKHLVACVREAESSQRGFIITQDSVYMLTYRSTKRQAYESFGRLENLLKENSQQLNHLNTLKELVSQRFEMLESTMQLAIGADSISPEVKDQFNRGRQLMYRLRLETDRMVNLENSLLKVRISAHRQNLNLTPVTALTISIFCLIVIVGSFLRINSDRKKMNALNREAMNARIGRERDRLYEQLIQGLPTALFTCDREGYLQVYNKAASQLWGREPVIGEERWCGSWKLLRTDGEPITIEECPMWNMLHNGTLLNNELIIEREDGTRRNIIPHPQLLFDEHGQVAGALNMLTDITEEKQARLALEESEIRLRVATEGTRLATWDLDLHTREIIYSPRINQIFGQSPETHLTHRDLRRFVHPDDHDRIVQKAFEIAMETSVYTYEARIIRPDGTIRWIKTDGKVLFDESGAPIRMLGTMRDITDQREAQEKLILSEKLFKSVALNIPNSLIAVIDRDYTVLALEGDVLSRMGLQNQEFEGKQLKEVSTSPERYAQDVAHIDRALSGEQFSVEQQVANDNKFMVHFVPLRTDAGEIYAALVIALDITEFTRIQERISMLGALVESSEDVIISKTLDGIITSWNASAERVFGYTEAEMIGKPISTLIPEDRMEEEHHIIQSLKNGQRVDHFETKRIAKSGAEVDLSITISPIKDSNGKIIGASKIARDVSLQKNFTRELERQVQDRTEELRNSNNELKRQKELAETILNTSIDINIVYDAEMNFMAFNHAAEQKYGKTKEEMIGRNLMEVFPEIAGTKGYQDLQKAIAGKTIHNKKYQSPITKLYYEDFFIPLKNAAGEVYAVMMIARDITDTIKNEELLIRLNETLTGNNRDLERSNTELASFNHVASHDLQEPLRKIQTFVSRIVEKDQDTLSEKGQEYFLKIQSSANRMQKLIDDLLTFSRTNKSDQQYETVDLDQMLETVKRELSQTIEEKNAVIEHDQLPVVGGITFQFQQLFTNLIGNALKYSRKDVPPVIRIHSSVVTAEEEHLTKAPAGKKFWKLTFADNGIGFEQQYAHQIFELFQRLHGKLEYTGTGIGLTICKKIVENHYGYIRADGKPGEGAVFTVFLPW